MSASQPASLCALLPSLPEPIAAGVIRDLLASVPRLQRHGEPPQTDRALVAELAQMQPRDLEEAMLAMQFLAAHHTAALCNSAAIALDPASSEASRLRRDAAIQQRVLPTLLRAIHRARARPLLADDATGEVRPTVPIANRAAVARRPRQAEAEAAEQEAAQKPWPPPDLFDDQPELKELARRWATLPRWEDMTMEERRRTWGYKHSPEMQARADAEAAAEAAAAAEEQARRAAGTAEKAARRGAG